MSECVVVWCHAPATVTVSHRPDASPTLCIPCRHRLLSLTSGRPLTWEEAVFVVHQGALPL